MSNALIMQIKERQLQTMVIQLANLTGWRHYHPYDSRKSVPGYPDLTLVNVKQRRLIFAELKTAKGRISKAQQEWLDDLTAAGQEAYVWRPDQWVDGTIRDILTGA